MKKYYKNFILVILITIFSLVSFILGILVDEKLNHQRENQKLKQKELTIDKLKQKINTLSADLNIENNDFYIYPSEVKDYKNTITYNNSINKNKKEKNISKNLKPKLVIILDDISFAYQVKAIKNLPFKITPSFFPPNKIHPYTLIYAKEFKDYMVHVPMQALHFSHPEPITMNINWSYNQIKTRIENIKKWFPKVKFINNHTGSKFTSNLHSMNYLFKALKEENLGFVDSKTTPFSKAKMVEKIYHIPFFERNIFLDNKQNVEYIKNQLKKAIKIAKKKGYAIAIGHPNPATIEALRTSKDILKEVDVISINELYKLKEENGN
jgi:polysaccharide deacetylase 2 family uncharacterized protein YibQ